MPDVSFFISSSDEVRAFIERVPHDLLDRAACRGRGLDAYHPEVGVPDETDLAACDGCAARVACVALAFRAEDPDVRSGWYGGLGPDERDELAEKLGIGLSPPAVPERAAEALRLFEAGWTIKSIATEFGCSRRTVQRYLRLAA